MHMLHRLRLPVDDKTLMEFQENRLVTDAFRINGSLLMIPELHFLDPVGTTIGDEEILDPGLLPHQI